MALSKEKAAMNHYGKRTGREVENHHLEVNELSSHVPVRSYSLPGVIFNTKPGDP
jgi:hypothetical protein